jgi:hypothetical protein
MSAFEFYATIAAAILALAFLLTSRSPLDFLTRFLLVFFACAAAFVFGCATAVMAEPTLERPAGSLPGYLYTYVEPDGSITFTDRLREDQDAARMPIPKGSYSVLDVATLAENARPPHVWQSFYLPCPTPCPVGACFRPTTHAKECY